MTLIKKYGLILLATVLTFSVLLGCTKKNDEEQTDLKKELQAAIAKQEEIANYRFSGSANVSLDWPALTGMSLNPLTASLASLLTNGEIAWHGISDTQSARMEIDLQLKPNDQLGPYDIPALVNNSKLYIRIPLLSVSEDDYLTFDLDGDLTSLPFSAMLSLFVDAFDAKYFTEQTVQNNDEKTISIEITADNIEEMISSVQDKLPAIAAELDNSKLLSDKQVENWFNQMIDISNKITIDQPGAIDFTIDKAGFLVAFNVHLYIDNQHMMLSNELTHINESIPFTKEIPENVRSIKDMLGI